MKKIIALLLLAISASCVMVVVNVPSVCDDQSVSFQLSQSISDMETQLPVNVQPQFPDGFATVCGVAEAVLPAEITSLSYQLPAESTSTSFDFSSAIGKVNGLATDISVNIIELLIANPNNEFSFVSSVQVMIQGNDTVAYPPVLLAEYTAPSSGNPSEMNITQQMNADQVLAYLGSGPVQMTIILNSNPLTLVEVCNLLGQQTIATTAHMCVSASGKFSKEL